MTAKNDNDYDVDAVWTMMQLIGADPTINALLTTHEQKLALNVTRYYNDRIRLVGFGVDLGPYERKLAEQIAEVLTQCVKEEA